MQWLQSAFQGQSPGLTLLGIVIGLAIALVLLFWVFRQIAGTGGHGGRRGREPRLAVVDAARIDGKRRLVLVRRDGVEHLVMIGGGSDVLIESHIGKLDRKTGLAETEYSPPISPEREARHAAPAAAGSVLTAGNAVEETTGQQAVAESVEPVGQAGPDPAEDAKPAEPEPVEIAGHTATESPETADRVELEPVESADLSGPEPVESGPEAEEIASHTGIKAADKVENAELESVDKVGLAISEQEETGGLTESEPMETVSPAVQTDEPAVATDPSARVERPGGMVFPIERQTGHTREPDEPRTAAGHHVPPREAAPLEEALGAELENVEPDIPEPDEEAAPKVAPPKSLERDKDEPKSRPRLSRDSSVEDEMQRLLDELSNT